MNKVQSQSNTPAGIQKVTHTVKESDEALNAILRDVLQTREVRQLLITVVPEFLNVWAGRSWWKKTLSKIAGFAVDNQLSQPDDVFGKDEISALFENEKFIKNVTEQLPGAINGVVDALSAGTGSIERMSVEDKKQLFSDLLSQTGKGRTGAVLTRCARTLSDIHTTDPEFFTKAIEPGFTKWVESADFGEIREMFDTSAEDGRAFVKMANNVLWEYPAKMVMILSLLPSLVNFLTDTLDISVGKLNDLPPDLLTDVILSFARESNSAAVAGLLNQLTEIVRKIHTGSALLGEPGAPQLPKVLSNLIADIVDKTDPITLWKAKIALAETGAAIGQAMADGVNRNPALKQLSMIKGPEITNIHIKSLNQKLSSWESVDDEEMAKSMGHHLAAYDVQELGEVLNNALRIINRLGTENPAMFTQFASELVNAIDDSELAETGKRFFNGVSKEFKPVARAVVPGLVTWICDVLQPTDDEYEDDAAKARDALASLFAKEEV